MKTIIVLILGICMMVLESNAQAKSKDYYILKKGSIGKNKILLKFTYNDNNNKNEYKIEQIDKSKLELKDVKTNKIVETYLQKFVPPDGSSDNFSCENQAKQQWKDFNLNTLPNLIKVANDQCRAINYCKTISCDGVPQVFYFLFIRPTNKNCIQFVSIKKEVAKYRFKRL